MGIRKAEIDDWREICELLNELDYPKTEPFIKSKMERLLNHPDEELLVYEYDGKVVAFITFYYTNCFGR